MNEGELFFHPQNILPSQRAEQKNQRSCVLWFTGLSGAGKSTVANALEQRLFAQGYHSYLLDGDCIRQGLNKDLGFAEADRTENIRRVGEMARLMTEAGLIVLSAFISPFTQDRQLVRDLFAAGDFVEIFMSTALSVCEQRDPKGLYKKARAGVISQFTGIDSPYEPPKNPELMLDMAEQSVEMAVDRVWAYLVKAQIVR